MNVNPDKIFFTSDLHFGHENIIRFCSRPYNSVEEMDDTLVDNWNAVVPEDGIVFLLGDVSFHKPKSNVTQQLLWALNGEIHLIRGNHDEKRLTNGIAERFKEILDYKEIRAAKDGYHQRMVLSHYPLYSWNKMQYGSWMLHGHSHGTCKSVGKMFDVGVDTEYSRYSPLTFQQIRDVLDPVEFVKTDYHMPRSDHEEQLKKEFYGVEEQP